MKIKYMKKAINRRKLRAYDEAIRKAKIALDCCDSASTETKNTIYNIFPELEDERIREEIIDYLKQKYSDPNAIKHDYDKWIVWLEKQGEQKSILNIPSRDVILSIWDLGNEWKELTNGCISTEYGTQLDYIQKHWHESEYYLKEKQREQKSIDKVEPKFHVGDWITNNIETVQITGYDIDYGYQVDYKGSLQHRDDIIEKEYHIWTIEDAKDGDILATEPIDSYPFPFVAIYENRGLDFFNSYCFIGFDGKFYEYETGRLIENIHPATKEQCDLLFEKMHEAGYEWAEETKELTKFHVIDEGKDEMDYCFTKMMNGEKVSSAWGEEDERIIKEIDEIIYECPYCESKEEISNWLKSLKQRIGG